MATYISSWDSIGFLLIHREGRLGETKICPECSVFWGEVPKRRNVISDGSAGLQLWYRSSHYWVWLAGSQPGPPALLQRYTSPLCESLLSSSETSISSMNLEVLRRFQNGSVTSIIDFFAFWVTCFRKENKDRKRHFGFSSSLPYSRVDVCHFIWFPHIGTACRLPCIIR